MPDVFVDAVQMGEGSGRFQGACEAVDEVALGATLPERPPVKPLEDPPIIRENDALAADTEAAQVCSRLSKSLHRGGRDLRPIGLQTVQEPFPLLQSGAPPSQLLAKSMEEAKGVPARRGPGLGVPDPDALICCELSQVGQSLGEVPPC